jgi:hypothetical protein
MVTIVKSKEATAMTALDSIFGTQSADNIFLPSRLDEYRLQVTGHCWIAQALW